MDDTLADVSGIPFLPSTEDIPCHSTPIKGSKVPLPSTRDAVRKTMRDNQQNSDNNTLDHLLNKGPSLTQDIRPENRHKRKQKLGKPRTETYKDVQGYIYHDLSDRSNLRPHSREYPGSNYNRDDFGQGLMGGQDRLSGEKTLTDCSVNSPSRISLDVFKENAEKDQNNSTNNAFSSTVNLTKHHLKIQYKQYGNIEDNFSSDKQQKNLPETGDAISANDKLNSKDDDAKHSVSKKVENLSRVSDENQDESFVLERPKFNISSPHPTKSQKSGPQSPLPLSKQNASFCELENTTLQKQRQEIQLLMSELKDRDRELSDMVTSHQQQLEAWQNDQRRVQALDKLCSKYQEEVKNLTSQLRQAISSLKATRSTEGKYRTELETLRDRLDKLLAENKELKEEAELRQTKTKYLQDTVQDLSAAVGRFQAKEEELTTSLRLKEKDMSVATTQMRELSERLQQLDLRCKECQDREKEAVAEKNEWKKKCENVQLELQTIASELGSKRREVCQLSEEKRSARQQLALLQKETGMREKCKDDLIESLKIKQDRTDHQLKNLRELYERQLREVALLQQQLDSSKATINRQQSSLDEQQLSLLCSEGSSQMTDPNRLISRRLSYSPEHRSSLSSSHRYREPDTDMGGNSQQYAQSSGYQSQLSDNQTGTITGNQTAPRKGRETDPSGVSLRFSLNEANNQSNQRRNHSEQDSNTSRESEASQRYLRNQSRNQSQQNDHQSSLSQQTGYNLSDRINNYGRQSTGSAQQGNVPKSCRTIPEHEAFAQSQNKSSKSNNVSEGEDRVYNRTHFTLKYSERTETLSPVRTGSDTNPVSERSSQQRQVYIQQTEPVSDSVPSANQPLPSQSQQNYNINSPPRRKGIVISESHSNNNQHSPLQNTQPHSNLGNVGLGKVVDDVNKPVREERKGPGEEIQEEFERQYVFENKLTSFLEELDDIDDSIWDEKWNKSFNQSLGDASPSSKLQKLLLESREMIHNLERSAESPVTKTEGQGKSPTDKRQPTKTPV